MFIIEKLTFLVFSGYNYYWYYIVAYLICVMIVMIVTITIPKTALTVITGPMLMLHAIVDTWKKEEEFESRSYVSAINIYFREDFQCSRAKSVALKTFIFFLIPIVNTVIVVVFSFPIGFIVLTKLMYVIVEIISKLVSIIVRMGEALDSIGSKVDDIGKNKE